MSALPVRSQFPILNRRVNNKPLVYFDNAATMQKPKRVIDAISDYYENFNSNIHRGVHTLAGIATAHFEQTRLAVQQFINAEHNEEIIFTRGTTEGINLAASGFVSLLSPDDEIIISALEHHSNIVPWQMAAQKSGAILKVIPLTETLELDMEAYKKMLSPKTKAVAVNHASNSVGTVNPIREIIKLAHQAGALVLIDGAQGIAHLPVDVQELDCDFYAFSGHKMYGPTGIGILYGKRAVLEKIPPYMGGGEMIKEVTFEKTTYNDLPYKFEAGTPNIADSIALKTAVDFIAEIGKKEIAQYENELLLRVTKALQNLPQVKIIGTAKEKVGIVSFVVNGIHPFDVGQWLDAQGIAVRTGHHCAQPLMTCLKLEGTVRASFALYNTKEEIDFFIENLQHCIKKLG